MMRSVFISLNTLKPKIREGLEERGLRLRGSEVLLFCSTVFSTPGPGEPKGVQVFGPALH